MIISSLQIPAQSWIEYTINCAFTGQASLSPFVNLDVDNLQDTFLPLAKMCYILMGHQGFVFQALASYPRQPKSPMFDRPYYSLQTDIRETSK